MGLEILHCENAPRYCSKPQAENPSTCLPTGQAGSGHASRFARRVTGAPLKRVSRAGGAPKAQEEARHCLYSGVPVKEAF